MIDTRKKHLNAVELKVDQIFADILEGKKALASIGIIPCICCSQPFSSRGVDNRVCNTCRDAASAMVF